MSLVWGEPRRPPRQAIGGLVIRPLWRVPDIEEARPPRWLAPLSIAAVLLFIALGTLTVLKALDFAVLIRASLL